MRKAGLVMIPASQCLARQLHSRCILTVQATLALYPLHVTTYTMAYIRFVNWTWFKNSCCSVIRTCPKMKIFLGLLTEVHCNEEVVANGHYTNMLTKIRIQIIPRDQKPGFERARWDPWDQMPKCSQGLKRSSLLVQKNDRREKKSTAGQEKARTDVWLKYLKSLQTQWVGDRVRQKDPNST